LFTFVVAYHITQTSTYRRSLKKTSRFNCFPVQSKNKKLRNKDKQAANY